MCLDHQKIFKVSLSFLYLFSLYHLDKFDKEVSKNHLHTIKSIQVGVTFDQVASTPINLS